MTRERCRSSWCPAPSRNIGSGTCWGLASTLVRAREEFDFDTLVVGHAPAVGTKEDVGRARAYLEDPVAAVEAARAEGVEDNSPAMVEAVRADLEPEYGELTNVGEWQPLNIGGVLAAEERAEASPAAGTPAA